MKNLLESFAILFVAILSLAVVFFIVQYNMIEDDTVMEEITFTAPQKKVTTQEKTKSYLDSLEGYGDDTDVKVDATKESTVNKVIVRSELKKDDLSAVVEDKSKASYMENLENYAVDSENEAAVDTLKKTMAERQKRVVLEVDEPEKLPQDEIVDDIGIAIDAALDDL